MTGWIWRALAALGLVAAAGQAVRVAAAQSFAEREPELAARWWPAHPAPQFAIALGEIGTAAREGRAPERATFDRIDRAAARAPLATEPLAVAATARLAAGDQPAAEQLLRAAIRRDARAPASRYLLAELLIRQGRIADGLRQVAALDRRLGGMTAGFAPAVAATLRDPAARRQVAPLLAEDANLRSAVLSELAKTPANAGLILALLPRGQSPDPWLPDFLVSLLGNGRIAEARALWERATGAPPEGPLADAAFTRRTGNYPFGWRFAAGAEGLAEPAGGGRLRALHYGRSRAALAAQITLLAPGRYRLAQRLSGSGLEQGQMQWQVTCLQSGTALEPVALRPGAASAELTIPGNCPAQRLELIGLQSEIPRPVDAEISNLSLSRVGSGA